MDIKSYISLRMVVIGRLIFMILLCSPLLSSADEVRVGALLSLSGDYAALGTEIQRGIELAQMERGQATPRIEIIVEDIQTLNNRAAISAAQKLLSVNSIDIAVSSYASESEPLAPIFQKRGVPLMVLWDSTHQLLNAGSKIFSNGFSTEGAGRRAAEMARDKVGVSRVAVISHVDGWSSTFARSFIDRFRELGGTILSHQELAVDSSDFRTPILKAKSLRPDGLVFPLVANPSSFLMQARAAQITIPLITGDTMIIPGEIEAAGASAEGVYFTAIFTDKEEKLQKLYSEKFGEPSRDPVSVSFGYDGMQTIYNAAEISKTKGVTLANALTMVLGPERSANRITDLFRINGGKVEKLG